MSADADTIEEILPGLRTTVEQVTEPLGLSVSVTGNAAVGEAIGHEVEEGILRAESVAILITLLLTLLIFGSVIAAGLPLMVGILAMVTSIAVVLGYSALEQQSIFAINVITLLGLALGVDYSLFMVARFREELRKGSVERAIAVTMGTVGKAILFAGITVIFGLAATRFFPMPALHSMGLAGMLVVALALFYGLTFLPAMLALLGHRINAVPVRLPARMRGNEEGCFWNRVATSVMKRPIVFLVPTLVILVFAGIPFLRLNLTAGGADQLPADVPARMTYERLQTDFPSGEADPIPVIVATDDESTTSAGSLASLELFVAEAAALPHVSRVTSVLSDPDASNDLVRLNRSLVQVVADVDGEELENVVKALRTIDTPGLTVEVGGAAASNVDTIEGIRDGIVPAVIFVVIGSYLILLLTFGSVFLPIKAIFMTLLSISASLGALVFVFQDGRLENLLRFTATGEIISVTPILMFCILFGLSMDYEVLMLTRIQEEYQRTGNNTASVAFGLEKTAKVITGAAAIMIVAFGAFMLADISIIKSMGFGLALAVLIDATIVRALLVPATMRLMGNWNWWAPRPIKSLVDRLGLVHSEPQAAPVGAAD
ncbi:MMPL family transporter [soil metagenome]